jgi:hypothetical protein
MVFSSGKNSIMLILCSMFFVAPGRWPLAYDFAADFDPLKPLPGQR